MADSMLAALVAAGLDPEIYAAELAAAPARLAGHETDPRRCCEDCKRDLGLIASPACPTCDGLGRIEVQHPSWGARWCPEPYIEVQCPTCGRGDAA